MIINTEPDKEKAKSLIKMARITLERLKETNKKKYPSNTLTDYYDIIRELMEALNALEGIKIKGEGAHFKIINHICNKYNFNESDKQFIQDLRDYRNRISYEGFNVKESFIESNAQRIEKVISSLLKIVKEKLEL
jgi:hypothetical protein